MNIKLVTRKGNAKRIKKVQSQTKRKLSKTKLGMFYAYNYKELMLMGKVFTGEFKS